MQINIYNGQKDLILYKKSVRTLVQTVLSYLKVPFREVSIYFVSKSKITALHDQFFQDPTPTDCISFPVDEAHLGEVFVCPLTAIEYAEKKKLNPYDETALYIIHGLLHLIGFDDLDQNTRRVMRKNEKSCMKYLNEHKISLNPK